MTGDIAPGELSTIVTAAPGGVMTDEVGVITGSVEIACRCDDGNRGIARVRYQDAGEWYTITDVARALSGPDELPDFHRSVVERFATP
ncbi:hypothetical protein ASG12_02235 [Williamsia sp. Leaf354]|uniref:hypothetical protein n=1 Tax=Williamsia sp. Leaf354 TaxID=1736349 RepID=UPI0006F4C323|nr:hypothetical protein [Williamsia sp. Leaf354]KQR99638.1 hypothetical protein ASG12_02235 [Williamsia sp. Leaf354]